MQLALIVQLSISMLAGELAGSLPITALWGAVSAVGGPVLVWMIGALLARRAVNSMDTQRRGGAERFFAFCSRAHWIATACIVIAASSELPSTLLPSIGGLGLALFLMSCGVATSLSTSWNAWTLERRIRESALMRALDRGGAVHSMPSRSAYVLAQARASLAPILAPLLVPLLLSQAALIVANEFAPEWVESAQVAGAILGTVLLFLLVPLLVPPLLGLRRLASGELRTDLESLARTAGVGVSEIWVWPTDGLIANAAVMGIFPGLRCVMLSDALLECMPRTQVRAVMAHELGHVVYRHLPWLIVVILACWSVAGLGAQVIAEDLFVRYCSELSLAQQESAAHTFSLARDGAVLIAGLAAFGFVSRRFERQADSYAVRLLSREVESAAATEASVEAMVGALGSVAFLNHVPPARSSWRHGSIHWRQEYLRSRVGLVGAMWGNDRFVQVLRWLSLALVLGLLALTLVQ